MLKTVIPSEAGQFFLALRSREALARAVEESLFSARSVLNPSFFSFNFQLSTSCLVLNCPSSPPSLASRLPPQVVRSSGRIPKEIPILLIGSDLGGKVFSEHTSTILLSLHGAGVLSRHKLSPEQELVLRWPERNKETEIRVVGQVGSQDGHHTYGVAFFDQDLNFWEIDFPPVSAAQRELGLLSLICSHCKTLEKVDDSGPEADVCATNEGVLRFCKRCGSSTLWKPASAVT
ncbi:MAG TPA: PilZ domain-containing protein, partial [Terriglobales bacterium]|nr:PilZ domain-containing protein [Terriglobales bacterium]